MKILWLLAFILLNTLSNVCAQNNTVTDDKNWQSNHVTLSNTAEADYIIRLGDIDNLNFGWEEDYDPFCGRSTYAHGYPWDANPNDIKGMDRILLSSKYVPGKFEECYGDGYSNAFDPASCKPQKMSLPTSILKTATIKNAYLQIFVDDFQAPQLCSKFQVWLNDKRFLEAEKIMNALDQTGPIGKLVTIAIPEEFYQELKDKEALTLYIDEVKGAGDGFAIDFVRLLVNRNPQKICRGNVNGIVMDKNTMQPIGNAQVIANTEQNIVQTDATGKFSIQNIPSGYQILTASAPGYKDGNTNVDVAPDYTAEDVIIYLETAKGVVKFKNKEMKIGDAIDLQNIFFEQGKHDLKSESYAELDKVVEFMKLNAGAEIELSGHTSSEGDAAYNRSLSYKRVNACKNYIVSKSIDATRIIAKGFGPDKPIAPNNTEDGRAKNRRVEMRITKL